MKRCLKVNLCFHKNSWKSSKKLFYLYSIPVNSKVYNRSITIQNYQSINQLRFYFFVHYIADNHIKNAHMWSKKEESTTKRQNYRVLFNSKLENR